MDLVNFYVSGADACQEQLRRIRRQTNSATLLRAGLFILLVGDIWYLFLGRSGFLLAGALALLGGFVASVNWYFRLKDERLLWEKLLFVNENEKAVLEGRENGFPDGREFLEPDNYLDDLDIFGSFSVFHALNRTTSLHGTGALAGLMREPLLSPDGIREQQLAAQVLAEQADVRRLLMAKGLLTGDRTGDLRTFGNWLNMQPEIYQRKLLRAVITLLTLVNIGVLLYTLATGEYIPLVVAIVVCRSIKAYFGKSVFAQHRLISHKQELFEQYADILAVFNTVDAGDSAKLAALRDRSKGAHSAIHQLSRLSSFFDQRLNWMVNLVLNSLAFYDLQCMVALERWKLRNREPFPGWIDAVGEIESLNSVATFSFNNPDYVWPMAEENADRLRIETRGLAHPLIPAKRRVVNDFNIGLEEKLILVTGSNMSGKTTFLRTVGVNLLLAQCGAPVCASAFSFTPMQLLTSLRISDSLQEQTSYFMAELKKLQRIVRRLETGAPTLVLIDEILRGTNSEDKTYGSDRFARKLAGYRCLSLFATHDLALGKLETELPGLVANYCFESVIEDGDLYFNYRLQRGIARNRNASFLMEKMKII